MTIKGLTDKGAALPRLGIIRKGGPKNGNRPGPDLSYFRFVSELPEIAEKFEREIGKEPKQLNIFLLFDEVEDSFEAWQEEWVAGGLKHRCDGETCVVWLDTKTNKYRTDPKPCPGGCKPVGRLSVLVPELGHIATVTVLTTSKHDIMSIQESLEAAKWTQRSALYPAGRLAGIPFVLSRREREISTPAQDGKRARRRKSLLWIEPAHHYAVAALRAMDATPLLLSAGQSNGEVEDDDEFVDQITGEIVSTQLAVQEIISPSEDHGKAEPTPEPAIISEEENAERIQCMKEIEAALPVVMVSESQLNVNAVKHAGVKDWRDANTAYLKGLAAKMREQAQKKQAKPEEVQA